MVGVVVREPDLVKRPAPRSQLRLDRRSFGNVDQGGDAGDFVVQQERVIVREAGNGDKGMAGGLNRFGRHGQGSCAALGCYRMAQ